MIITIFGATGLTGSYLVKMALWKEHTVRAYGRNVHELVHDQERHEQLHLFKGGMFDQKEVRKAIEGADVVLSASGGTTDEGDRTRSLGMKTIIAAMQETGVQRIIGVGGAGILSNEDGSYIFEGEDVPKQYLSVSKEHFQAFQYLERSGLQWTFVCPPQILDTPVTAEYHLSKNVPPAGINKINAGDLASFMLNEMTGNNYLHCRVGISN
ncbi:MAG: NAD(P)H-binding protein [Dinghuibacter sp.]|nr:NAD(P)H-binding protein [Dinghuibacter sp.]